MKLSQLLDEIAEAVDTHFAGLIDAAKNDAAADRFERRALDMIGTIESFRAIAREYDYLELEIK